MRDYLGESLQVGCILLGGLFFYDIFWVFGTDVMVWGGNACLGWNHYQCLQLLAHTIR